MELMQEILIGYLKSNLEIKFSKKVNFERIVEKECYKALKKIRNIIQNDHLDDVTCFEKIEEIVCLFENMGIDCGNRHDF